MNDHSTFEQADDGQHLEVQHGMKKTVAYIPCDKSKQRSANASRVAKHREKKKALGLVKIEVTAQFAEAIKAAGSFKAWLQQHRIVPIENYRKLNRYWRILVKVESLPTWKRWIIDLMLDN